MTQIDPLLLAIARAGLPGTAPPPRDGWEDHLDAVLSQGLAGLFAATAAAGMVDIDAYMAGRLQRQLDAEAVRAVQLESELLRLAPALEHLGAVVLKGAVLAHAAYPDPLLRPFTDIDLLVPGDQIDHAIVVLATHGYQRARPEPAPGYDARVGKAVASSTPAGSSSTCTARWPPAALARASTSPTSSPLADRSRSAVTRSPPRRGRSTSSSVRYTPSRATG